MEVPSYPMTVSSTILTAPVWLKTSVNASLRRTPLRPVMVSETVRRCSVILNVKMAIVQHLIIVSVMTDGVVMIVEQHYV